MTCTQLVLDGLSLFLQKLSHEGAAQKKASLDRIIPTFKEALDGAEKADKFIEMAEEE